MKGWDRGALEEPQAEEQKEEHHGKWIGVTARAAEIHERVSHMTPEPRLTVYRWRCSTWDSMFWSWGWDESSLELRSQRRTCWLHDLQNRRWSLMLFIFSMNRYIHSVDPEPNPPRTKRDRTRHIRLLSLGGGAGQQKAPGIEDFPAGVLMGTITEKTSLKRRACTSRLQEILGGDLQFAPLSGKGHRKWQRGDLDGESNKDNSSRYQQMDQMRAAAAAGYPHPAQLCAFAAGSVKSQWDCDGSLRNGQPH